jgi:hypothetical protein
MPEVGVPVEMDQPVATRVRAAVKDPRHQDAAVAAEHQRGQAAGSQQIDALGQTPGMLDDGDLVAERTGGRIVGVPAR